MALPWIGQRVEIHGFENLKDGTGEVVDILEANKEYDANTIYKYYLTVRPGLLMLKVPRVIVKRHTPKEGYLVLPWVGCVPSLVSELDEG